MLTISRTLLLSAVILAAACGEDDADVGETTFTASVAAVPFIGETDIVATYSGNTLAFSATMASATGTKRLELGVANITTTGDYSINAQNPGNFATYSEFTTSTGVTTVWGSSVTAGTGTITVTQISSSHVKGTFNFNAPAVSGGATGNKLVLIGVFNIPVTN